MRNKQGIIVAVGVTFVAFCVAWWLFRTAREENAWRAQHLQRCRNQIDFVAAQGGATTTAMMITIQTVSRSMSVLLQLGQGATQLNDFDNGDDLAADQ